MCNRPIYVFYFRLAHIRGAYHVCNFWPNMVRIDLANVCFCSTLWLFKEMYVGIDWCSRSIEVGRSSRWHRSRNVDFSLIFAQHSPHLPLIQLIMYSEIINLYTINIYPRRVGYTANSVIFKPHFTVFYIVFGVITWPSVIKIKPSCLIKRKQTYKSLY